MCVCVCVCVSGTGSPGAGRALRDRLGGTASLSASASCTMYTSTRVPLPVALHLLSAHPAEWGHAIRVVTRKVERVRPARAGTASGIRPLTAPKRSKSLAARTVGSPAQYDVERPEAFAVELIRQEVTATRGTAADERYRHAR